MIYIDFSIIYILQKHLMRKTWILSVCLGNSLKRALHIAFFTPILRTAKSLKITKIFLIFYYCFILPFFAFIFLFLFFFSFKLCLLHSTLLLTFWLLLIHRSLFILSILCRAFFFLSNFYRINIDENFLADELVNWKKNFLKIK